MGCGLIKFTFFKNKFHIFKHRFELFETKVFILRIHCQVFGYIVNGHP